MLKSTHSATKKRVAVKASSQGLQDRYFGFKAYPKGPCTQNSIYFGLKVVPKWVLWGQASSIWVHGPLGLGLKTVPYKVPLKEGPCQKGTSGLRVLGCQKRPHGVLLIGLGFRARA